MDRTVCLSEVHVNGSKCLKAVGPVWTPIHKRDEATILGNFGLLVAGTNL